MIASWDHLTPTDTSDYDNWVALDEWAEVVLEARSDRSDDIRKGWRESAWQPHAVWYPNVEPPVP